MENKRLLNLVLIASFLGIFILLVISENVSIKESSIIQLSKEGVGKRVMVSGFISNLFETEGLYLFDLTNNSDSIKIVLFKNNETKLYNNNFVFVEGELTEYKGDLEITAKRIIFK